MRLGTFARLALIVVLVASLCVVPAVAEEPPPIAAEAVVGTAFTYQGRLTDNGNPASGTYDFEFKLYDGADPTTAMQIGAAVALEDVAVTNGLFTVSLDFGTSAFVGQARWLQVGVRPGTDAGAYTALDPLTPLNATPHAASLRWGARMNSGGTTATGLSLVGTPAGGAPLSSSTALFVSNGDPYGGMVITLGTRAIAALAGVGTAVEAISGTGTGLYGLHNAETGTNPGVHGQTRSNDADAAAVLGKASATTPTGSNAGVRGENDSTNAFGYGVYGSHAGTGFGVYGTSVSGTGVQGSTSAAGFLNAGVRGVGTGGATGIYAYSNTGDIIVGYSSGGLFGNLRFKVNNAGNVYADGSYNCGLGAGCFNTGVGADLAERVDASEALQPGNLVEIDPDNPGQFRLARTPFSTLVAGFVSTNPAITMNNNDLADNDTGERTDERPLLALVGQVPAKVSAENGAIAPGDLLVASSTPGHAMKAGANPPTGTVVGKAMQALDSGTGVITVLVTLQ